MVKWLAQRHKVCAQEGWLVSYLFFDPWSLGKSTPWPLSYKDGKAWRLIMVDNNWMGWGGCPALLGPCPHPSHVRPPEGLDFSVTIGLLRRGTWEAQWVTRKRDLFPRSSKGAKHSMRGVCRAVAEGSNKQVLQVREQTAYSVVGKVGTCSHDPLSTKELPRVTLGLAWGPIVNEIQLHRGRL